MKSFHAIYLSFLLINGFLNAQSIPYNQEFQVNTYIENSQFWPVISELTNNKFVVCWTSNHQDGSNYGVYCQLFNSDGTKQGSEFRANTSTQGSQVVQDVCSLSDGGFVVCWGSIADSGTWDCYAQIFNHNGSERGTEFQLNTHTDSTQSGIRVIELLDSTFIACWQSLGQDGSGYGIFAQIFSNEGDKKSPEFQVNTYSDSDQDGVSLAKLGDDRFISCWSSKGQDGDGYGIFAQIFDLNGNRIGSEFQVNTHIQNDQHISSVCLLQNDNLAISWDSYDQDGDNYGIFCQIFDKEVNKIGSEFQVNTYSVSSQTHSKILSLDNSGFIVCWMSFEQNDNLWGIFCQLFNIDGTKKYSEFHVNNFVNGRQDNPDIALVNENKLAIVWASQYQVEDTDIIAKFYLKEPIVHTLIPYTLLEPTFDSTLKTLNPTFRWQQPSLTRVNYPFEIKYTLQISEDESFSSPSVIDSIYDTTYTIQNLTPGTTYFWKVLAKNIESDSLWCSEMFGFFVDYDATFFEHISKSKMQNFQLYANYPNPFNPITTISYKLPESTNVTLNVYDINGQLVTTLIKQNQTAGIYKTVFNAKGLSSGIYFYNLTTSHFQETKKMLFVK